ncbi:phthiocerol/phthiodiolone dimycocerosyl transferase family protein [Chlorogloeopsis sp. ULAP02]|uniref:phthiocerol/phthiodiolone dimycocerosyl transferase family protein n=1 Tax=Chlorogloeopsis sp. ULAP02 TaxID=3107926 RepID=UPI0031373F08
MLHERKLSPFEEVIEAVNRRASAYNIVTICRIKGIFSEEILRQALEVLQTRHPRLNCRIVGKLNSLRFETAAVEIPLRVVEKREQQQWQEVALEELNQKIDSHESLLRVVLVRVQNQNNLNYLITTIHHAIADGLSCIQLHSELLSYCQKITSFEPIEVTPLPTLPPLERLLLNSIQGWKGGLNIFLTVFRHLLKQIWYRPQTLKFEKFVPIESRRSGMIHRMLNQEQTRQLLNACRQNQTTVHSALCAAMLFVAGRKIIGGQKKNTNVSCWSAINLRKHLEPVVSDEHLGMLFSGDISFHTLRTNTPFWDLACNRKQQMKASIEGDRVFCSALLIKPLTDFLLAYPRQMFATVGVTNVGRVNVPSDYSFFELEEISFVPAWGAFGGLCVAVLTFESKMFLNFMFSEPAISQEVAEVLADNVISCLLKASNNKKFTFADQMSALSHYLSTSSSRSNFAHQASKRYQ